MHPEREAGVGVEVGLGVLSCIWLRLTLASHLTLDMMQVWEDFLHGCRAWVPMASP